MEKGGLVAELNKNKVSQETKICWADEMRIGLMSQVRKIWCSIGTKVVQKIQISYSYSYLYLAVDGLAGTLHWQWGENMKTETAKETVQSWSQEGIGAIIWDGASSHRSKEMDNMTPALICQPPYAPELNPAERVFEAIRQEVEGEIYKTIDAKQKAVEVFLTQLSKSPEKIQSLAGWSWIQEAIKKLPVCDTC